MQKCEQELPRPPLIIIYKVFIKSYIYYGDVFYDQPFGNSLHQRLEPTQETISLLQNKKESPPYLYNLIRLHILRVTLKTYIPLKQKILESNPDLDVLDFQKISSSEKFALM